MTPGATLLALSSVEEGLTSAEADRRLAHTGPNELREERRVAATELLLRQFRSPLIYILILAGAVTTALGEYVDAGVIGAVLLLNALIGFVEEHRAERSMAALRRLAAARAVVMRDRRAHTIDARRLVPGDVVLLEAGSKVPADCRILHAVALEADEALLTGESATVAKGIESLPPDAPLAERANMLFMGTVVVRGRARAAVVATGARTELGRIADELEEIGDVDTPLQGRIARLARQIGVAVLAIGAVSAAVGVATGEDLDELFFALVALAVSAIPEGLPVVLTIALALSVRRMAARGAVVRRLPAVETLGSCTVIGADKTGTLTQNRMTVERIFAGDQLYEVTGTGYRAEGRILRDGEQVAAGAPAVGLTLRAGALCNDASIAQADGEFEVSGDPTEVALLVAAAKGGVFKGDLEDELPRWAEIPFDSERRYAATFHRAAGRELVFVKGAPERVLEMCTTAEGAPALDRERVLAQAHAMAAGGLRVLAMATCELPARPDPEALHAHLQGLTLLGVQGMMDPPREEARLAVQGCQEAGIRVVMITGDHATTALTIARELGITGPTARALTGADLDALGDDALAASLTEVDVFARVSPEHKLRITRAFQSLGHVVAVTGDGVNDAPALKAADIGAAMGLSGTDVAKEAADMVITDDNFATIFAAVEEGRVAFDNVRKTTFFLISSGVAEVLTVVASLLLGFPLPLLPAQLLWLNLVTNGIEDVALAFERAERDVRSRPPRRLGEGVISPLLWERTALVGAVMAAGTLLLFLLHRDAGATIEEARSIALTTLVMFQVFHVGNCRSEHSSAFSRSPFANRFLLLGTATALAVHVAALYLPATQSALRIEPLDLSTWVEIVAVALTVVIAVELHKLVRRPAERPAAAVAQRAGL